MTAKHRYKVALLLPFLCFAFYVAAQSSNTYHHDRLGFSLAIPKGWHMRTNDSMYQYLFSTTDYNNASAILITNSKSSLYLIGGSKPMLKTENQINNYLTHVAAGLVNAIYKNVTQVKIEGLEPMSIGEKDLYIKHVILQTDGSKKVEGDFYLWQGKGNHFLMMSAQYANGKDKLPIQKMMKEVLERI